MSTRDSRAASPGAAQATGGQRRVMLVLATVGFAVNFWAWALLSPLAPKLDIEPGRLLSIGQYWNIG